MNNRFPTLSADDIDAGMKRSSPIRRKPAEAGANVNAPTPTSDQNVNALPKQLSGGGGGPPHAPAVPAFSPFPENVLPEPIRSFVTSAAKAIGCDPSYIVLPLLAGLAAAIGNTRRLRVMNTWHAPPIIWTAIVGESGTMKSPAFKLAMKPVRNAQARAWKEHEEARKRWEIENLRHETDLAAWKRRAASAIDPPAKPETPILRRFCVADTTVEALIPILRDNPRGVLLSRDELSGWLGSFDRYAKGGRGGADSAHWLSMHDGEAVTCDRKSGNPPTLHVPSAAVSIAGGIQPGILARAMTRDHHESGMLARILLAMPPRRPKRWSEADVDPALEAAVEKVFDWLYALTTEADEYGEQRPMLLTMTPQAKAAWINFYNEHNADADHLTGDESAAWSKLEGYVPRLALVLHLVRWAAKDTTIVDPARVDEASITAGVTIARWFGEESRRVYAVLGESDQGRDARELLALIHRKGGSVSGREVVQSTRRFKRVEDAEAALNVLVDEGHGSWMTPEHSGPGGPKARRFVLHPVNGVNVYRNPPGGTGNGHSVDVDGVDTDRNAGGGEGNR